jgi:hypothetical protein
MRDTKIINTTDKVVSVEEAYFCHEKRMTVEVVKKYYPDPLQEEHQMSCVNGTTQIFASLALPKEEHGVKYIVSAAVKIGMHNRYDLLVPHQYDNQGNVIAWL